MEYEIEMGVDAKIKADFTRNTYYDTNLTSQETIKFRVIFRDLIEQFYCLLIN